MTHDSINFELHFRRKREGLDPNIGWDLILGYSYKELIEFGISEDQYASWRFNQCEEVDIV
jgi:hypothetical protein